MPCVCVFVALLIPVDAAAIKRIQSMEQTLISVFSDTDLHVVNVICKLPETLTRTNSLLLILSKRCVTAQK